jgi:hypothetical protein
MTTLWRRWTAARFHLGAKVYQTALALQAVKFKKYCYFNELLRTFEGE